MDRRKFIASSAAALFLAKSQSFAMAQSTPATIKLTVATGHSPVVTWVKLLDTYFIPEVDKRLSVSGKYQIEWTKGFGGTIAKIGGEIDAVEQGITDIAIVGATFQPAKLPLQVVSYYTPFATNQLQTIIATWNQLHSLVPEMQEAWKRNRLLYLAGIGVDNFQLFMSKKVSGLSDLSGLKIGGIGPNLNWLKGAGIAPVQVDPNSIYNDLSTGVYDGVLLPTALASNLKTHEVAPYMLQANFGAMCFGALAINSRKFNKLPPEVQKIILAVGQEYQSKLIAFQEESAVKGLAKMTAEKLNVVAISDADRKAWTNSLPQIAKAWAEPLEAKGLPAKKVITEFTRLVRDRGGKIERDWTVGL